MGLLALPVNASAEVTVNICSPWGGCRPADLSTSAEPVAPAPVKPACTGASCVLGVSNEMLPPPAPMGDPSQLLPPPAPMNPNHWMNRPQARTPRQTAQHPRPDDPLFIPHLPPFPSIAGPFGNNWYAITTPSGATYYNMGGYAIYGPDGAYVGY